MNRELQVQRRSGECADFQDLLGQALIPSNRVERLLALAHFHACPHCAPAYRSMADFFAWCREQRPRPALPAGPYQTMGWGL